MNGKQFKRLLGKIQFPPTAKLVDVINLMKEYQKLEAKSEI